MEEIIYFDLKNYSSSTFRFRFGRQEEIELYYLLNMMNLLKTIFVICSLQKIVCDCDVVIRTPLGHIRGTTLETRLGKTIYAFRGIRYALPPVGDLRFKPPIPVTKWDGIYNATMDGYLCPQPTDEKTSEDCLILNVYSTLLPNDTNNITRPVLLFLHAGGFYGVGSASYILGPQYLMDQDIVLVTINYRLGSLGFLATGTREAPGNNGLKDQVTALRWVKNNIASYGGDPNSVTIMGYSAGAMSSILHMMSPMSKGLFHKVIAMSYSPLGSLPIGRKQLKLAKKQARLVGCPDDTVTNIIACLKNISHLDLGNSLAGFAEFGYDPIMIWTPVIEKDFGQERYLTDHPINLIRIGQFMNVPVVTGITQYEFGYRAYQILSNDNLTEQLNTDWQKIAPIAFCYERNTNFSRTTSNTLAKYYFHNELVSNSTLSELNDLYADAIIGFSVNRAVKLLARYSSQPVYYYQFNYHGNYSHFYLNGNQTPIGPVHHDDLIYLFYIQRLFPLFGIDTPPEVKMVSKLTKMWANFAKNGKPLPTNDSDFSDVKWSPFTAEEQIYLDIGNNLKERKRLYNSRYALWEKLFTVESYKENNYIKEYYE